MNDSVTSGKGSLKVSGSIDLTKPIDALLEKYINKRGDLSIETFFNKELREKIISPLFNNIENSIKTTQDIKVASNIDITKNINELITESFKKSKLDLSFSSLSNIDLGKKVEQIISSANIQDLGVDIKDTFKDRFKKELAEKFNIKYTPNKLNTPKRQDFADISDKVASKGEEDINQFKTIDTQNALDYILRITPDASRDMYKKYQEKISYVDNKFFSLIENNIQSLSSITKEQSPLNFLIKVTPEQENYISSRYKEIAHNFLQKLEHFTDTFKFEKIEEDILKTLSNVPSIEKTTNPLLQLANNKETDEDIDPEHDIVKVRIDDLSIENFGKMFRIIFKEYLGNIDSLTSTQNNKRAENNLDIKSDSQSESTSDFKLTDILMTMAGVKYLKDKLPNKTPAKTPRKTPSKTSTKTPTKTSTKTPSKTSTRTSSKIPKTTVKPSTIRASTAKAISKNVKNIKGVPLLGTALTAGIAAYEWNEINKRKEAKEIDEKQATKEKGGLAGETTGALAGGFAGMKAGAALGALGGPVGIAIGGVVGGIAGGLLGGKLGSVAGEKIADNLTEDNTKKIEEKSPNIDSNKIEEKSPTPEIKTAPLIDKSSPMQINFDPLLGYLSPAFGEMNKHLLLIENILSKQTNNNIIQESNPSLYADAESSEGYSNEFTNYGGSNGIANFRNNYKASLSNYI